ncbi:MAG: flagellar protein FlgN [Candidatus Eisenbacteria bacterium]
MATEITTDVRPLRSPAYGGLAEVVTQETRALEEFADVLERQRGAVSNGDRRALDDSVEDLDRLLLRLAKLREQRQSMVDSLSGERGWSLTQFVDQLGATVPMPLRHAQRQLRHAAENAARASRVNSVVLRRVLDSERAFLQSLFTDGPVVGYPGASPGPSSGWLLDRQG